MAQMERRESGLSRRCRSCCRCDTVECVVLNECSNFGVDQWAQWFEGVENEAVTMWFGEVKEADCKARAGSGQHCAEAAGLFRVGEVQHVTRRVRAEAARPQRTAAHGAGG